MAIRRPLDIGHLGYALDASARNGARLWSKTEPQRVAGAHASEPVDALRLVLRTQPRSDWPTCVKCIARIANLFRVRIRTEHFHEAAMFLELHDRSSHFGVSG